MEPDTQEDKDKANNKDSTRSQKSSVLSWRGYSGDLGILTHDIFNAVDIVKVSFGASHGLFQSHEGDVYVWGDNAKGQLGLGTLEVKIEDQPFKVPGLTAPAIDVACGENHCTVVNNEGKAHCWGDSTSGQCGVGSLDLVLSPTPVLQEIQDGFCKEHNLPKPPLIVLFESIACGAQHSLAISTDGGVWAWGCGNPLGLGEILHAPVPRRVEVLKDHVAIGVVCGKRHSMVMVLKGDKTKPPQLNSPPKVVVKAKDVEVDKHYPSRCKTCKKEIFSYTDTNDMCIIDTLHDCEPKTTGSDDATVVWDDSIQLLAQNDELSRDGNNIRVEEEVDLPASNSIPVSLVSSQTSSSAADGRNLPRDDSFSHGAVSSPEEAPDYLGPTNMSTLPETSLDGSLLSLPADTSLVQVEKKEVSPTKSSGSSKDLFNDENETLTDRAKILFKSENSILGTGDSDYSLSHEDMDSTMSLSTEHTRLSEQSSFSNQSPSKTSPDVDEDADSQAISVNVAPGAKPVLRQSQFEKSAYVKSISVESDDVVWKRLSDSADNSFPESKQHYARPSSPSAISTKSLNIINQSEAMEYLQRQFKDDDNEEAKNQPKDLSEKKPAGKASDDPTRKFSLGSALPYSSKVMEQVKSMTNQAIVNFQSLNVFRSLGGDSPTMEMMTVTDPKAVPRGPSLDLEPSSDVTHTVAGPEDKNAKSPVVDALRDDVFSSPESCSMISSVGSLTGEDVADSSNAQALDDTFHSKLKSGTFIEWRQEMSSVGDDDPMLNRGSNRRSLRTIEMQKRNLSCSSAPPSQTEAKQSPHQTVITTTEVWVWGHNKDGQLGIGDAIDRSEPVWLKNLSGRNVMKLAAGDSHSIALTDNSQFPKGSTVWDIAAGSQHSVFLGDVSTPGKPDVFYCGKQPSEEVNASLKKALVPCPVGPVKENGWVIRVFAGGTRCSCKVLKSTTQISEAVFELAASERSFYGQLIKTINLLLRPLRRSSFFLSLDVYPYKSTLHSMIASFGLLTTKIGKGVTDLTATIQHGDCASLTHFIRDRQEFINVFKNYSLAFSDFLSVGGFDYCTKTGSEFFMEIQGNIQDLPQSKEKSSASSSLFLRAMTYPFFRLLEYTRLTTKMVNSVQGATEVSKVYQNTLLDWDSLKLNFSSEHKLASNTKAFWDSINTRLADSLRQPSRRVLIESKSNPMTLPAAGRFSSQLFVLFNDIFLHSQNNVQATYPLVTLWVESGYSDDAQQNLFVVISPEEKFEFNCPTAVLKTEWLMKFKSAISRILIEERSRDSFHSSGERFTPPLIRHAMHKFIKAGIYKDASYNGSWLSGKIHGIGNMTWADGSQYIGNFKRGLMHGQGNLTIIRGQKKEIQQGTWKDGKLNGHASIVYANGDMYEGHIKDGQRHGHGMLQTGRIKSNCASVYIGEWAVNMKHGYGIEDHILKGEKYMGMWTEDARHGNGVMVTLDGMYFEGSFVHNKMTGFGVMISDDDTLYEGDFVGITHLSGRGTLTLPSGDMLEGAFSGSLNEGLKINGTFLKAANMKDSDKQQQHSHGAKSKYFGRLCIAADNKWTNVFTQSYSSLGQTSNSQQPNDTEKAWEAVAVTVSDGLKLLKKQAANSTKFKMQQSILQELEKIPSHDQEKLDADKVETISNYLGKAFESSHHPLGHLMNSLVDVFRASYIGVGAHPRLLHHAVQEVKSYVIRIYRVVRLLFPILPATTGPVSIGPSRRSSKEMIGVLPDPNLRGSISSFDEDDPDIVIFTAAGLLYPILLPKIYPPLFDLYALYNDKSDDRYWERVTKLNRQGDVGLMAYLGIEQQFWLIQNVLQEGKTQALSSIKDVCYAEAVDQLQQLSTAFSPVEKLKVIEQTFNQITQTVTSSLGDDIMWCMDDLFPIFQFVVVRAKLHHLGAEIHLIEDLMESHLEHGEFGLMFTTLKACYFQIQNEKMPHH